MHACERTHKSSIGNDLIIVEMTSDIKFATFERRVKSSWFIGLVYRAISHQGHVRSQHEILVFLHRTYSAVYAACINTHRHDGHDGHTAPAKWRAASESQGRQLKDAGCALFRG